MPDATATIPRTSLYGFEMREPDLRRVEDRQTYDIKQLWQRSHEILALAVRGLKGTQIAELLDISPQTVSNTLNSDLGQRKLSVMRRSRDDAAVEVSERIAVLTERALDTYEEIFDDDVATVDQKRKTADVVMLELSGYRVPTKVQSQSFSAVATLQEIEEFKKRGLEAQRAAGMIVEVEGEGSYCRHGQCEPSEDSHRRPEQLATEQLANGQCESDGQCEEVKDDSLDQTRSVREPKSADAKV